VGAADAFSYAILTAAHRTALADPVAHHDTSNDELPMTPDSKGAQANDRDN